MKNYTAEQITSNTTKHTQNRRFGLGVEPKSPAWKAQEGRKEGRYTDYYAAVQRVVFQSDRRPSLPIVFLKNFSNS